jgi:hypothetical protein
VWLRYAKVRHAEKPFPLAKADIDQACFNNAADLPFNLRQQDFAIAMQDASFNVASFGIPLIAS